MTAPQGSAGKLGCAREYVLEIRTKGGRRVVETLDIVQECQWERQLHEPSTAYAIVPRLRCPGLVTKFVNGVIHPWSHELTFYRDGDLVWSGPITRIVVHSREDFVKIEARDMMAWTRKRGNAIPHIWGLNEDESPPNGTTVDAAVVAQDILTDAWAQDDPNAAAYMIINTTGIPERRRLIAPFDNSVFSEMEALVNDGATYTTVGRRIIFASSANPVYGPVATLTDEHILSDIQLVWDGDEWITHSVVIGEGVKATAGGPHPYYGLLTEFPRILGALSQTTAQQNANRRVLEYAPGNADLYVPDDARLSPEAPITMDRLVAGMGIDLMLNTFETPLRYRMTLQRMTCRWFHTGENVGISLIKSKARNKVKAASDERALTVALQTHRDRIEALERPKTVQLAGTHRIETRADGSMWVVRGSDGISAQIFP
jgi:hypothetical protein